MGVEWQSLGEMNVYLPSLSSYSQRGVWIQGEEQEKEEIREKGYGYNGNSKRGKEARSVMNTSTQYTCMKTIGMHNKDLPTEKAHRQFCCVFLLTRRQRSLYYNITELGFKLKPLCSAALMARLSEIPFSKCTIKRPAIMGQKLACVPQLCVSTSTHSAAAAENCGFTPEQSFPGLESLIG